MKIFILITIIALNSVLSSCQWPTVEVINPENSPTKNIERLGHPIELYYLERSGMTYMIASGINLDAGNSIRNLTLDSLQVKYYKYITKKY